LKSLRTLGFAVAALAVAVLAAAASAVTVEQPTSAMVAVEQAVAADDYEAIKAMGPSVMPRLVRLYGAGDEAQRQRLANLFYRLGWKSEAAKDALMKDVHTPSQGLRLSVQWALGRVSNDVSVVDVLLDNMQNDAQLLFRDKAACALAYDQIHLTPAQKVHLYEGLIHALDDPKMDVRRIAALVLQIQTGQDKGFHFAGPLDARARAVEAWRQWLAEYRSQL
jgi:hypothetical protein